MPYIKSNDDRREKLRNGEPALNAGELNYQLFYYVKHFYDFDICFPMDKYKEDIKSLIRQFLGEKPNYQRYNDMTGVMIRCYKEIKRRLNIDLKEEFIAIMESYDYEIAKYEDTKILENSDVE